MSKLIILGSGTCVPSLRRSSCSLLVCGRRERLLLDLGTGTIHQLLRAGYSIDEVDAVLLSHFHPDHAGELPGFLFSTKYPQPVGRTRPLRILAGEGLGEFYSLLKDAYKASFELPQELVQLRELEGKGRAAAPGLLNEFSLEWTAVEHRLESRAYRITTPEGRSLVYSGDTDYSEQLIELARGADLLVCESAFPDEHRQPGHLTPSLAGEIAARAGVGQLVLTHFYPVCEQYDLAAECRHTYQGPLILAEDLLEIALD